jgi:hypothetical protein
MILHVYGFQAPVHAKVDRQQDEIHGKQSNLGEGVKWQRGMESEGVRGRKREGVGGGREEERGGDEGREEERGREGEGRKKRVH